MRKNAKILNNTPEKYILQSNNNFKCTFSCKLLKYLLIVILTKQYLKFGTDTQNLFNCCTLSNNLNFYPLCSRESKTEAFGECLFCCQMSSVLMIFFAKKMPQYNHIKLYIIK